MSGLSSFSRLKPDGTDLVWFCTSVAARTSLLARAGRRALNVCALPHAQGARGAAPGQRCRWASVATSTSLSAEVPRRWGALQAIV